MLYLFVCFQKTSRQLSSTEKTKNEEFTFSKAKRPSSTVTVVLQIKKLYRVDICDRNTSSKDCNEHIQTVMGQQKMQNLPALAQCRNNVMGQRWADEQTLGWPIQYLQPWANRAASDGPIEGQCIRAIWVVTLQPKHIPLRIHLSTEYSIRILILKILQPM